MKSNSQYFFILKGFLLISFLLFQLSQQALGQSERVSGGIYKEGDYIVIKAITNNGGQIGVTGQNINVAFTLRYPSAVGLVTFNTVDGLNFTPDASGVFIDGTTSYRYQTFTMPVTVASASNNLAALAWPWNANSEYTLVRMTATGANTYSPQDLELVNDGNVENLAGEWFVASGSNYYQTSGSTPFSPAKIVTSLPVELMSFNAKPTATATLLTWATASESNNKGFEVMRRLENEKEFKQIGFVNGKGTTTQISEYKFEDKHQATGTAYYMLRQIDFDLTSSNSPIVAVNYSKKNQLFVSLYPNPATDLIHVNVGPEVNTLFVNLYSAEGKLALTKEVKNGESLSVANLPQGLYQIIYTTETGEKGSGKLIIQK